ncbi:uncharacterized protein NPIL_275741, partial [Nephila pilipes]
AKRVVASDGGGTQGQASCQQILCKAPCKVVQNSQNCPVCQCNGPNGNCQIACPTTCSLVSTNNPNCPYYCSCL